ncbi:MAG: S-layer homology domain-containing protein [Oscillospiraceae bacterium]|nr:S-layer homology domain-containing protein [Oscillospiraceae bacterium]
MKKRILSLALTLALTLTLIPATFPASAAAGTPMPGWSSLVSVRSTTMYRGEAVMAIKADNSLWVWGTEAHGVLGTGSAEQVQTIDTPIKIMDDVLAAGIGDTNSFVLKTDGSLWVSGEFRDNRGSATLTTHRKIMDGAAFASIWYRTLLAVKTDGSLWLWDGNIDRDPAKITDEVVSAVATSTNSGYIIRTDGNLWSLENSRIGAKIMDGVASVTGTRGIDVSSDGLRHFAIKTDGSLWGWGKNVTLGSYGTLGDGTSQARAEPVKIMDGVAFISPQPDHTLAVKTDGTLWAWGNNASAGGSNPTGYGNFAPIERSRTGSSTPVQIMTGDRFIYAGAYHAVKTDGSVLRWSAAAASPFQVIDGLKLTPPESLLGGTTPPPPQPNPLDTADTWAKDHITSALAKGFVPADIQNNYRSVITRQEFARMAVEWVKYALGETDLDAIVAAHGRPEREGLTFSDTTDANILAAYRLGITAGAVAPTADAPGQFNPNGDFTRQEAATMIMNTCRAIGADISNPPTADFADLSVTVSWAQPGINFVRANGIMSGDGTNFNPTNAYTRQESIVTFNNIEPDDLP